jgi:hypothetical protein
VLRNPIGVGQDHAPATGFTRANDVRRRGMPGCVAGRWYRVRSELCVGAADRAGKVGANLA